MKSPKRKAVGAEEIRFVFFRERGRGDAVLEIQRVHAHNALPPHRRRGALAGVNARKEGVEVAFFPQLTNGG